MKTCLVLFVLVTLTTYCRGRTRWRIIEYDDADVDRTKIYKNCMKDCAKDCEELVACKTPPNDPDTLCRTGQSEGVFMMNGKPFHGCEHLLNLPAARQPDEPKRPFEVADLWKLFEAK